MVSKRQSREEGHRRKFLTVVDNTPECARAVTYAARRAAATDGGIVLLYVIEPGDFQHWLGVEEIMRQEAREEAETALAKFGELCRAAANIEAETQIREGKVAGEIIDLIEVDRDIAIMVLAAGGEKEGPGPLVGSIAGRDAAFPIPVTVVPYSLTDEDMEGLV